LRRLAVLLPQLLEQRLLVGTLAQRRQFQGQAADAVVQVLAKAPGLHQLAQCAVGRRDDAQVHWEYLATAHRLHTALLQYP